jgi:hypothetical protein
MVTYFDIKKDEKERHENSLKAAAEIAEKAEMVALERDWDIEKATNYVRKLNPQTAEMEFRGYLSEEPARSYSMTSYEAGEQLADMVKKLQRSEKLDFATAQKRVFEDEANAELIKCYTHGE